MAYVRVRGEDGRSVVLPAGSVLPGWAVGQVSNAAAYVEENPAPSTNPDQDSEPEAGPADYAAMTVLDLRAEIKRRNQDRDEDDLIPDEGKKVDLIAALETDDGN